MPPPLFVLFIPGAALFFLIQMILCRAYRFEVKLVHHKIRPNSPMLKMSPNHDEKGPGPNSHGRKNQTPLSENPENKREQRTPTLQSNIQQEDGPSKNRQNSPEKPYNVSPSKEILNPNQPQEDRVRSSQDSKNTHRSYDVRSVMIEVPKKESAAAMRTRRQSVCAESYDPATDTDPVKVVHPKSPEEKQWLKEHLKNVSLFNHLANDQLNTVADAMHKCPVKEGDVITREGDEGNTFYVVQDGVFDVFVRNDDKTQELVKTYDNEGGFGELALLYNQPRAATVVGRTDGTLWAVDGDIFRRIIYKITHQKRMMYENLINNVPMLQQLEPNERANLVDALVPMKVEDGQKVITQGDEADGMYFIISGGVKVILQDGGKVPHVLSELTNGDYFGELGLLTKRPRVASVFAVGTTHLAFLPRESFERLLGPCMDIMKRNIDGYNKRLSQILTELE